MENNNGFTKNRNPDPDEINLLEYFYVLIKYKWIIIVLTLSGFFGGYFIALQKGPVFVADAVITPKETETQKTPSLSSLGMFGGMIADQLNIAGYASLGKIDLILESRTFNAELVEKKKLMHDIFYKYWDKVQNEWIDEFEEPEYVIAGGYLKSEFFEKEKERNNTMTIKVEHPDSVSAYKILSSCINYLDSFIRRNVQKEAKENRKYLEEQLISVTDPLLQAKIQELIAKELEKMMVVSKEAFKIIDNVFVYKSFKEKKLYPLIGATGMFFITMLIIIFAHALLSSDKTDEDKGLIKEIKKELFRIPFMKN